MTDLKTHLSRIYIYAVWVIISVMFWAWIFTFVTDTGRAKKVTLFVDTAYVSDTELSVELEKSKPDGIKMIKARSFDYVMFDDDSLTNADIFIVGASKVGDYFDSFIAIDEYAAAHPEYEYLEIDGRKYAVKVYDVGTDTGAAQSYVTYIGRDGTIEDYYLFFGVNSLHLGSINASADDAAFSAAEAYMKLD